VVLFRLGGNSEAVRAQRAALAELGSVMEQDPACWSKLRGAEPEQAIVFRLSQLPSRLPEIWDAALAIAEACPGTLLHARPVRGVVRCIVPRSDASAASLTRLLSGVAMSTRIGERLPAALWAAWIPPATSNPLSRRIKATFDPSNVLNPGILGEER